jgi:starvation-inducible DNA-binding protein
VLFLNRFRRAARGRADFHIGGWRAGSLKLQETPMKTTDTAHPGTKGTNGLKRPADLKTPTDLSSEGVEAISKALRELLADVFALYMKTKNFHWHMSGSHFRDYHLLLDEHSDQIFAMTDAIAERARKIGGVTLHSIGEIASHQTLKDNDAEFVAPGEMLEELCADNQALTRSMRQKHEICETHGDVATTSLIETWIDETERRTWFLFETLRRV